MSIQKSWLFASLVGAVQLCCLNVAQAELIAYDGFRENDHGSSFGGTIANMNTGFGWSGPWELKINKTGTPDKSRGCIKSDAMNYEGLATSGGRLTFTNAGTIQYGMRTLAEPGLGEDGSTLWLSFLTNKGLGIKSGDFTIFDGDIARVKYIARYDNKNLATLCVGDSNVVTAVSTDRITNLVVFKIDFHADGNDIAMWVGTGLDLTSEATLGNPDAYIESEIPFVVESIRTYGAANNTDIWDEFRVATTFEEVVRAMPPEVVNGGITHTTADSAMAHGVLRAGANESTQMKVYWGTVDGGTSAELWEHSRVIEGVSTNGQYSVKLDCIANQDYFYRVYATNVWGETWSPVPTAFSTQSYWIESIDSVGSETVEDTLSFCVKRSADAVGEAIDVFVELGGEAVNGVDYVAVNSPLMLKMAADADSVGFEITPKADVEQEASESVCATLLPGLYLVGSPSVATGRIENVVLPTAPTNVWLGAGSASVADNWSLGHTPTSDEIVWLDKFSQADMVWDVAEGGLSDNVKGWVQTENYKGAVTFKTTYEDSEQDLGFNEFVVNGDVNLLGGGWTHHANDNLKEDTYRLNVRVAGDMMIGSNTTMSAYRKGRGRKEQSQVSSDSSPCGPGFTTYAGGASYGGTGMKSSAQSQIAYDESYGCIMTPIRLGSGVQPAEGKARWQGGGAISIRVGGELGVYGTITANGSGGWNVGGATSGGSVLLEVGTLVGSGVICADGGSDLHAGPGSGGRIAVYLTGETSSFETYLGTITAKGHSDGRNNRYSGAGTIYLETAQDGAAGGILRVNNLAARYEAREFNGWTSIPAVQALDETEDFTQTSWEVMQRGVVSLTQDVRAKSVKLVGTDARMKLNNHELIISSFSGVTGEEFIAPGTYMTNQVDFASVVDIFEGVDFGGAEGAITILGQATLLMIR